MCGIAGIVGNQPNELNSNQTRQLLQKMTDALAHRGPDGDGFWASANGLAQLGHRRLKIIDLSNDAAQPMHYGNQASLPLQPQFTITYNGEIYNYIELKKTLQARGFYFKTQSDTEVILAAYQCWQQDCLQYLDGMFAFAIWDEAEQQLFCARDRFGEKPFYYALHHNALYFASEMKALWAAEIDKTVNHQMLFAYLTLGVEKDVQQPEKTFYQNIFKLPAAHFLQYKNGDVSTTRYWDLDKQTMHQPLTEQDAMQQFQTLLNTSVQRRLRSDVAIGTSLSGGLDSSTIAALQLPFLKQNNQQNLQTFSAVFPKFEKDESTFIKEMATHFSLSQNLVTPTADGLIADFDKLFYHQEQPFQSSSIYAQYKVYQLAKQQGVTVLLDGQGADEILAGYHAYYPWYWQEMFAKGHWKNTNQEIEFARNNGVKNSWNCKNKLAAYLPQTAANFLVNKAYQLQKNNPFLHPDFIKKNLDKQQLYKPAIRSLNDILYHHTCWLGLEELLHYADRNSMAYSREVRLPFLSHSLVEFVFSLPACYKIKNGFTKHILRQTMSQVLPKNIVWRKDKVGFEPPQQQWMQQPKMQDFLQRAKQKLVANSIANKEILQINYSPKRAHDANNYDWRIICVAAML